MAQPLINIGAAINDGTGELGPRAWLQKINRLPNPDNTVNPLSGDYSGTYEQKITAAIADGVVSGKKFCWITQPYSAALVTFNNAIKMIREGGDPSTHDPQAYGALGNAVIIARASGAGTKATITGQDDTVALQACINAAAANLEIVLLPPNAFKITTALTLPTNTQLVGSGWNSQICPDWFDATGGQSGGQGYLVNADQTNGNANISISNFYINGACPGTPTASGVPNGAAAAIFFRGTSAGLGGCQDIAVKNMKITNTPGISISHQGCQRIQITGNLLHDLGKDGITGAWFNGANMFDVVVAGNTIYSPGDDGIAVLGSISNNPNSTARPNRIAITGNVIRDVSSSGAGRGIIVAGCEDVAISGNVVHNSFGPGIAVEWDIQVPGGSTFSARRITIVGNVIQDAGQAGDGSQPRIGIRLAGCQQVAIVGNVIDRAKANGILLTDNTLAAGAYSDVLISSNTVTNCGTTVATDIAVYGVAGLSGGGRRITIQNNQIENNVSGGIWTQALDQVFITGNQIQNNGTAGTHTGPESGISVGSAGGFTGFGVTVFGNWVSGANQTFGLQAANMGTALGMLRVEGNELGGNFTTGPVGGFVVNLAPTTLVRRNNRLTTGVTHGQSVLVGGTVTVNTAEVLTADSIHLTRVLTGGTVGHLSVGTIVQGTSFVINSSSGTDTSTVFWETVH